MALPRAACRGVLWSLGPGAARGLPRAPGGLVSSRAGLGSAARRLLERRFPRIHLLCSTFARGLGALWLEAQEIRRIQLRMSREQLSVQELPYRDMERLRQFRRDVLKSIPIAIIAIPPFANGLVLLLMYLFPRQLLVRHFWSPQQQLQFLATDDAIRRASYPGVLGSLALAAQTLPDTQLRRRLQQLCAQVQGGTQPRVAELCALRSLFSGSALALEQLRVPHVRSLSQVLFLTPHLPSFLLRRRLRSHVLEILRLDRALLLLGLGQLSEEELKKACYLRGLNSTHLDTWQCQAWLEQWLKLSSQLEASEASLLANCMVLLSLNYPQHSQ